MTLHGLICTEIDLLTSPEHFNDMSEGCALRIRIGLNFHVKSTGNHGIPTVSGAFVLPVHRRKITKSETKNLLEKEMSVKMLVPFSPLR